MAGRRILVAATAALLAIPAMAGETIMTPDKMPAVSAMQLALNQLFTRLEVPPAETPAAGVPEVPVSHMLMVRLKDGKPVIACVDSKEGAQRFLSAPVEKIGGHKHAAEK